MEQAPRRTRLRITASVCFSFPGPSSHRPEADHKAYARNQRRVPLAPPSTACLSQRQFDAGLTPTYHAWAAIPPVIIERCVSTFWSRQAQDFRMEPSRSRSWTTRRLGRKNWAPDHSAPSTNRSEYFRPRDALRYIDESVSRRCVTEGLVGDEVNTLRCW